jgi:type I restriction enzyme S subunit
MTTGPGVVTGRYGTLGEVFYIEEDFWPLNTTLYVRDFKGSDPRFISYFLRGVDFLAYSDKAAVPGLNRNHLHQAKVRFPSDVSEQRAIASMLSSFDDKIELNRQMNETLEAMAQAIFKSWFVDFDPVRAKADGRDPRLPQPITDLFPDRFEDSELGQIPAGWTVLSLDEIARFVNGLALQKFPPINGRSLPVIKIAQLRAGNTDGADAASADLAPDFIVEDGDVLFSWSGSLECVLWAGGPGALNQHLFKVTSGAYPKWLYYSWIHHHLDDFRAVAAGKATTMGHIQRHHLSEAKAVVPTSSALAALDLIIGPLLESTWRRTLESRTLAQIRDALLPKLISGEIRVRQAERILEAAPV